MAAVGNNSVINILDGCGISGATIVSVKSITLEFGVGLGANSSVYDTDFHPVSFEKRKMQKSIEDAKFEDISIGEGTLIGANSIVLKGSKIGKRCVIGAGSVVAKNIPDDHLAAGNPVRIIRSIEHE
ncbi:MAG: hypothetical protein JW915_22625 [Chitinispirillaceae bacterium]|nr:hypothetical protein [Chitinispirillaceae bacterium]